MYRPLIPMGKVIKNVVKTVVAIFCGLLLTLLVVPLAASLLISVPAIQNAIVDRVTALLSEAIGARVSVDRIDIKLVNRVDLEGFYVEDFEGDTLLWVPKLVAPVEELPLGGGQLTFGNVTLQGAQLWLRKGSPQEEMNISRVVDAIRAGRVPNPDANFRMTIRSIEADSLTFALIRPYEERRGDGEVDFSRFVLRDVHSRIDDFRIAGDTISMNIASMGGVERSGLAIEDLQARPLVISSGEITLSKARVRSAGSIVNLPSIRLVSDNREWDGFGEFIDRVGMEIEMHSSRVTTDFIEAFAPAMKNWDLVLDDVSLSTRGPLARLAGDIKSVRTGRTTLSMEFTSRGLPSVEKARFEGRLRSVSTDGQEASRLLRSVTGRGLPEKTEAMLERFGRMSLTGTVSGGLRDFDAAGTLLSEAGGFAATAKVRQDSEGGRRIEGELSTAGFDLGHALEAGELGMVAGKVAAVGTIGQGVVGALQAEIDTIEFKGYRYTGLEVDGKIDGRRYEARVVARDPALRAEGVASMDRSGETPRYALDLKVGEADLAALHFDREDSVSVVSGRVIASLNGRDMDDVNGRVEMRDLAYRSGGRMVSTRLATLEADNTATVKSIRFRSEFADGELRSRTRYRDIIAYLGGFLQKYIPIEGFGSTTEELVPPDGGNPMARTNYSILTMDVKNSERLLDALAPTANIADGTSVIFMFNPYTGGFSLSAESSFVEYRGSLAANISLTADNAADSLTVYLSGKEIYTGRGQKIPSFSLHGGAKGRIQMDVALDRDVWRIGVDSLGIEKGKVGLENLNFFAIDTPGRRLSATGVVSSLPTDTLHVSLNRFDLASLGNLLRGGALDINGRATGRLELSSAMSNPKINADIELQNLAMGGLSAPPLRFVSSPAEGGGLDYGLMNLATGENLVTGSLSQHGEIAADVRIDSIDVALLDPMLEDIIENTRGKASARLTLGGTFKNISMNGYIEVPSLETTVAYTRARYSLTGARMEVENSVMTLPRTLFTNRLGGRGDLAMKIDMSKFGDIRTEIEARIGEMLAFDTGPGDSEAFYGRVFATGSVVVNSSRMGTRMDISARTDAGTQFHMPLNAKSNVSWADFVVFTDRSAVLDTTDVLARKKQAYERRLTGGRQVRRSNPLELNLTANITPAAEVHMLIDPNLGEGIAARGEGVIDMRINPANNDFSMTGAYNIASGNFDFSMMNVFNKSFEIVPGSTLRWEGTADDAVLSVDASYRVRTSLNPLIGSRAGGEEGGGSGGVVPVDCIIRLRERLSDPEITFDIQFPSSDADARQVMASAMNTEELKSMQFLSLLTTGGFATDNSITGQGSNSGTAIGGALGFDILTNQLNNFLSSEDYDIYFRYRPQDDFATNQFDMGFSTSLWDDRLQLEIEGNYIDNRLPTSGTSNASNLAGDVSLTWVIDKAGNLRLKVFSQNIDRLDENQGMQESGLGVYYKREFDTIGDLFRRKDVRAADRRGGGSTDSVAVGEPPKRVKNK